MDKIPVFGTIGRTVGFAFSRYLSLLGIVWLPFVVSCAAIYFFFDPFISSIRQVVQRAQHHLPPTVDPFPPEFLRWMGLLDILLLLVYAMIRVGVAKEALGLRKGPRFVYFWMGAAEFRVIGAYFILLALVYVSIIAILLASAILGAIVYAAATGAIEQHAMPQETLGWLTQAAVAFGLIVALVWCYFAVRLSYFVVPVTVAERRFGILRSWELTRGNFWRIVAISIVIVIAYFVVEIIAMLFVFGPVIAHFGMWAAQLPATGPERFALLEKSIAGYAIYGVAIATLFVPIFYGLLLAPSAFAYRALVPAVPEGSAAPMMKEGSYP